MKKGGVPSEETTRPSLPTFRCRRDDDLRQPRLEKLLEPAVYFAVLPELRRVTVGSVAEAR